MSQEFRAPLEGIEDEVPAEAKSLLPAEPNQCPFFSCRKQYTSPEIAARCLESHTVRI